MLTKTEKIGVTTATAILMLLLLILVSIATQGLGKSKQGHLTRSVCVETAKWKLGNTEQDVCVKSEWVIVE